MKTRIGFMVRGTVQCAVGTRGLLTLLIYVCVVGVSIPVSQETNSHWVWLRHVPTEYLCLLIFNMQSLDSDSLPAMMWDSLTTFINPFISHTTHALSYTLWKNSLKRTLTNTGTKVWSAQLITREWWKHSLLRLEWAHQCRKFRCDSTKTQ